MGDTYFQTISKTIESDGSPTTYSITSNSFGFSPLRADACLKGWDLQFTNDEHPVQNALVVIDSVQIDGESVTVTFRAGMRDKSTDWDDEYKCDVTILVIAVSSGT